MGTDQAAAPAGRGLGLPALLAIAVGLFLAQLDGTVMNVALPALSRSFHTGSLSRVQPVITAYLVASVALLPILGKLADRLGRRTLFLAGYAAFGSASVLCALAPSLGALIALRTLQACGGALLSATALALVAAHAGPARGRSLGRLSIVYAVSGLLGPPLGGGLVAAFGWQAIFWLNVPLSLVGLALGARLLPAEARSPAAARLDLSGAALFAAGTALLVAGVATSGDGGPAVGALTLAWPLAVLAGLACYLLLWRWEAAAGGRGVDPLLNLGLLRTPAYSLGLLTGFLSNGLTVGLFVLVPFWLDRGWGIGAAALGLVFLPVALGLGGFAPFAGARSDRVGPRLLTTGGMLIGAASAALLAAQATALLWPVLLLAMLGLGAASGLFAAPNNNAVLGAAPERELAVAGSMLSAARTLGVILGVSAAGTAFDALRATGGANPAARDLFLIATGAFALNALICWSLAERRGGARPALQPARPVGHSMGDIP